MQEVLRAAVQYSDLVEKEAEGKDKKWLSRQLEQAMLYKDEHRQYASCWRLELAKPSLTVRRLIGDSQVSRLERALWRLGQQYQRMTTDERITGAAYFDDRVQEEFSRFAQARSSAGEVGLMVRLTSGVYDLVIESEGCSEEVQKAMAGLKDNLNERYRKLVS